MANVLTGNPLKLDTTSATDLMPGVVLWAKAIEWVSDGSSAGDLCTLLDAAGNTIFRSLATGDNFKDRAEFPMTPGSPGQRILGVVPTVPNGIVYVYLA